MSRLLQLFSLLLAAIAVMVGWRIARVARVPIPQFADPPQLEAEQALKNRRHAPRADAAMISAIVDGNIFDQQRGYKQPETQAEADAPLPPPTNVVLNGIMVVNGEPIAIVTDTKQGNSQLSVRAGEMIDAYEVGEIGGNSVTLLGPGGKKFAVSLDVKKGPPRRTTPGRPTPRRTPPRPTAARTAPGRTPTTPAARAAAARAAANRNPNVPGHAARARPAPAKAGERKPAVPDAARERLEALKALREAAAAR